LHARLNRARSQVELVDSETTNSTRQLFGHPLHAQDLVLDLVELIHETLYTLGHFCVLLLHDRPPNSCLLAFPSLSFQSVSPFFPSANFVACDADRTFHELKLCNCNTSGVQGKNLSEYSLQVLLGQLDAKLSQRVRFHVVAPQKTITIRVILLEQFLTPLRILRCRDLFDNPLLVHLRSLQRFGSLACGCLDAWLHRCDGCGSLLSDTFGLVDGGPRLHDEICARRTSGHRGLARFLHSLRHEQHVCVVHLVLTSQWRGGVMCVFRGGLGVGYVLCQLLEQSPCQLLLLLDLSLLL